MPERIAGRAVCTRKDQRHRNRPTQTPDTMKPSLHKFGWAEAPIKIARMTLTIKLDRNWSSFQLANSAPPLSVTDSAIAPSARMGAIARGWGATFVWIRCLVSSRNHQNHRPAALGERQFASTCANLRIRASLFWALRALLAAAGLRVRKC